MPKSSTKFYQILAWLLPTGIGLFTYTVSTILLAFSSLSSYVRELLFTPKDFNFSDSVLTTINDMLSQLVGDLAARNLVVVVFWGMIGLMVYIFVWLGINFSTEFGNDLAYTKYLHPKGVDVSSPLRNFLSKAIFRFCSGIVLFIYTLTLVGVLIPLAGGLFYQAGELFFSISALVHILMGSGITFIGLHTLIIFVRLLTLRKRIFGEN
ncbi:MAG: hypothetical protein AAB459_01290 [Patescibacteria group bacterium]|jgi:hypothetical protein